MDDIDSLFSKGLITKTERPDSDPLRYAICPVIEDPTDGGIAIDQFLALPLKANGTPGGADIPGKLREARNHRRLGGLRLIAVSLRT